MTGRPLRVLLADDEPLYRGTVRELIDATPGLSVVAEAATGGEAVTLAAEHEPDVVLMDVRMPGLDGIAATARITAAVPAPRVLVLTTFDLDDHVHRALRAGASGFVLKDIAPPRLLDAIHTVAAGDALLAPSVTRRLLDRFAEVLDDRSEAAPLMEDLTEREVEVLRLVALALSNAEIAARLVLTEATVKTHVSSILRKLDLRDRVQAVVFAYDVGLVRPRSA
jgi:DNA-binding NarL/FixJ family response regulator